MSKWTNTYTINENHLTMSWFLSWPITTCLRCFKREMNTPQTRDFSLSVYSIQSCLKRQFGLPKQRPHIDLAAVTVLDIDCSWEIGCSASTIILEITVLIYRYVHGWVGVRCKNGRDHICHSQRIYILYVSVISLQSLIAAECETSISAPVLLCASFGTCKTIF